MTDRPSHARQIPTPPRRETALSRKNAHPPTSRSLWDIAHPLEVAYSILIHHADPMEELRRRVRYARKGDNPAENLRFWGEVTAYLKASLDVYWDAP